MNAKGIYTVIGTPYSGSTLLSFIIGSHSNIYNGADLHHLNPEKKGSCSLHKESCPVLSLKARNRIYEKFGNCDSWYDEISDITGKEYIFDASKQLNFFREVLPVTKKDIVIILLNKHPMRALCSDIYNRLFDRELKINGKRQIISYIQDNKNIVYSFIEKRLDAILKDVKERNELVISVQHRKNILQVINVKYEDYIEDVAFVAKKILAPFGLEYSEKFVDYSSFEHHPITGNMGPLWKVKGEKSVNEDSHYRKNYYTQNKSGIVMDNKYLDIFDEETINWIESRKKYKELIYILNYEPVSISKKTNFIKRLGGLLRRRN